MRKGCHFLSSSLQRIRTSTVSQSGLKPDVGAALSVLPLCPRLRACVPGDPQPHGYGSARGADLAGRWKRLEH